MENKDILLNFLKSQKALIVASVDQSGKPYVTNLFMGVDDNFKIYFISSLNTIHSQHIENNSDVAFSTVWFNEGNHKDRKGVQGRGLCRQAKDKREVKTGVGLHNKNYPEFADRITVDWIKNNDFQSKVWIIEPSNIKYWDDEHFGEEAQEFSF